MDDQLHQTDNSGQADKKESAGAFSLLGTASTMGMHMVSGPLVGSVLGWFSDRYFELWPICSAIGFFLGLAAGFRNVWIDAQFLKKNNELAENKKECRMDRLDRERYGENEIF